MVELSQRRTLWAYLTLGAVAALYLYRFVRVSRGLADEGEFLVGAQRVLEGAIPSRDFVALMGPGSFFWLAGFFKLFGTSFATAQAVLLATGVATVLLVFHLARRIGSFGVFAAAFAMATLIPQLTMNSSHHDSNLFLLLSFAVFLNAQERSSVVGMFVAGLLGGLASCFIQQKGALAVIGYVAILILQLKAWPRLRLCFAAFIGFVAVLALELLLYARSGALRDLFLNNIVWPTLHYSSANSAPYGFQLWMLWWPQWFAILRPDFPLVVTAAEIFVMSVPYLLVMALPGLMFFMGALWRKTAFSPELVPYWVIGYAMLASELHRTDLGHLINGSPILLILFFALCERSQAKLPTQLTVAVMACLAADAGLNYSAARGMQTTLHTRRGTVLAPHSDAALDFLTSHTQTGEDVFVYPYAPRYYFMADVRNPTRFTSLMYSLNTDEQFREAVKDLESKKVRYVLWDSVLDGDELRGIFPAYVPPPANRLIMEPYLQSHYRQTGIANGFRILERIQ